ncbi:MAG: NAD-binding protein [Dehalococcoidia bacterium]
MSQINMMSKVSVIGCGNSGSKIAINFANIGYQIDIIDINYKNLMKLPQNLISEGYLNPMVANAMNILELKKIIDPDCNTCIILAGNDSTNALISQIFKNEFNISKIICKINDQITNELYSNLGFVTINQNDLFNKKLLGLFESN